MINKASEKQNSSILLLQVKKALKKLRDWKETCAALWADGGSIDCNQQLQISDCNTNFIEIPKKVAIVLVVPIDV